MTITAPTYEEFCKHYELNPSNPETKDQYRSQCELMRTLDGVVTASEIANQAIIKASSQR